MNHFRSLHWIALALLGSLLPLALSAQEAKKQPDPARWEKEAAVYEAREKEHPSPKGGILFSGSSSIRLWDLKKSFPDLPVLNRGLGGSIIPDNTYFVERLIFPHEPKLIVFYAGDNDLASQRQPEQLLKDFQAYVEKVRTKLPDTPILFIAVKPSIARWKLYAAQQDANGRIKAYCEKTPGLGFIDIVPATLGKDGQPQKELFRPDGLHLTDAGYAAWTKVIREAIDQRLKSAGK